MDTQKPLIQTEIILDLSTMAAERVPPAVANHLRDALSEFEPGEQDVMAVIENGLLDRFVVLGAVPEPHTEPDPEEGGHWNPVHVQVRWFQGPTLEKVYQQITEWRDAMYAGSAAT